MEVHTGTNTGGADRSQNLHKMGGLDSNWLQDHWGGVQNPTALVKGIQLF